MGRARTLERSRLPADRMDWLEGRSKADTSDAERAIHPRNAMVSAGRAVDFQRRYDKAR